MSVAFHVLHADTDLWIFNLIFDLTVRVYMSYDIVKLWFLEMKE